ncbi:MAG: hypothetical protein AB8C13_07665 [Phycisphaerales bacterium]
MNESNALINTPTQSTRLCFAKSHARTKDQEQKNNAQLSKLMYDVDE